MTETTMYLAIDSSLKGYSAALYYNEQLVFALSDNGSKSQYLITDLKTAFEINQLNLHDLEYLIVNIGPGSFTGIRTTLTLVKTLAANLDLKVITINNFELLRYLNPDVSKLAFRASQKNLNEYFVSLDMNYEDLNTNYFATEINQDITLLELPDSQEISKKTLDWALSQKDQLQTLASKEIKPYYLREPSLRLPKQNVTS
jgi:tRNA threonylcarbamoyladenosine biosynthesis protein TsaB